MSDLIRDATFGSLLNYLSKGKLFPYDEQKPGYEVPDRYIVNPSPADSFQTLVNNSPVQSTRDLALPQKVLSKAALNDKEFTPSSTIASDNTTLNIPTFPAQGVITTEPSRNASTATLVVSNSEKAGFSSAVKDQGVCKYRGKDGKVDREAVAAALESGLPECEDLRQAIAISQKEDALHVPHGTITPPRKEVPLVDWDGPDDPANPKNWSTSKKLFVTAQICLLTFAVYAGSAIYTPSIPGIMEHFNTNETVAVLGLTLFVFGYGVGPMLLTPLQELPVWGRTPVYIIAMILFTVFQLPIIFAKNVTTIMIFRFASGFIGSPALATGGASLIDMWADAKVPYAISAWAIGAVLGPVLAPVLAGYAAMNETWQWPMLILTWISALATIVLFFFLPETLASTILLRKARRMRRFTGNKDLRSQSEIDQANTKISEVFKEALTMPLRLLIEPAVFVVSLYLGLVYAIFYLFFESFPLIYGPGPESIYGFNLGTAQLPFLAFAVTGAITFIVYWNYQKYRIEPLYVSGKFTPEHRLEIGLIAACSIPIIQLIFGWTARKSVHWIVPVIFGALYLPGVYLSFQSILVYLPTAYYSHAGSVLAANDLFRSTLASVFPLFGHAFYVKLGLGGGATLLAGLSLLMVPAFYYIKKEGANLRAKSKFAH